MSHHDDGADRVGHGEASLGDAQAANPPEDAEMIADGAAPRDRDDPAGEDPQPPEERGNEDPAPNAP